MEYAPVFFDQMPLDQAIPYLYRADIMLVVLRETKLFRSAIPSKFFDCMAAGKPILSNVNGELRDIMENSRTGLYFSIKNKGEFVSKLNFLKDNPDVCKEMGIRGKRLVKEKYLRSKMADKFVDNISHMPN